jgi:hypothetical protein
VINGYVNSYLKSVFKICALVVFIFLSSIGYADDIFVGYPGISGTRDLICDLWVDRETVPIGSDSGIYSGPYVCAEYHIVESNNGNIYIEKLLSSDQASPVSFNNEARAVSDWTPSMTSFLNFFAMAYKNGSDNRIYYSWSQDGRFWNDPLTIGNLRTPSSPRLQTFNNRAYMFYAGYDNRLYYTSTGDGVNWEAVRYAGGGSAKPPTLTVFNGRMYMVYRGRASKNIYINSTADGINWSGERRIGADKTSESPYVAVHDNQLFIAFKGGSSENIYLNRSADGVNWAGSWQPKSGWKTKKAPAIASYNNRLYLAHTGTNSEVVWYSSSADGISAWETRVGKAYAKSGGMLSLFVY